MNRFAQRVQQFMAGRYGTDQLSIALLVLYFILLIFPFGRGSLLLMLLSFAIVIFYVYRTMSRNGYKRSRENEIFLRYWSPVTRTFGRLKRQVKDREHRYYQCPSCRQSIRVPKGKGKICITCPSCRNEFVKRT